jgi:hypothetical protein
MIAVPDSANIIKKDIRKLCIIATKGSLDMAYPPLIPCQRCAHDWY